ncbi:MAG: flagellar hook-basal body complex protein, partial [Oscillospiraceae bacterium]
SKPSKDLGLSSVSLTLTGGTEGGPQTAASLTSVSITPEGIIQGVHPELGLITIGRLDLVTFENPEGLTSTGNSYFSETNNSGKARLTEAGKRGSGKLATGSLEMSNVDLSKVFYDMIVTQRGFQANSRLITVSDEMLTELVNLKR